jgi:hypothetical protein
VSWIDDAVRLVRDHDRSRPRSRQAAVGWSEAGGCRAAIGYRLDGAFADDTDTWAAQRGTAVHEYLGPIIAGRGISAPGPLLEVATEYRGIPGHADIVDVDEASVTDIKTTTLANSKLWAADHSLLRPKRIQAHGYAAGLVDAGELPADCMVRILVIPVDGTFADWWAYEEPFDRALADEGADRVEWVRAALAAGDDLPKDKPYAFCETWCGFFALCRAPEEAGEMAEITDPEIAAAVDGYGDAHVRYSAAEKEKKRLASLIRGYRGVTAAGWRVSTSGPGDAGEAPDMAAIEAHYEEAGLRMPMTATPGSSPRLTVTRLKAVKKGE